MDHHKLQRGVQQWNTSYGLSVNILNDMRNVPKAGNIAPHIRLTCLLRKFRIRLSSRLNINRG